MKIKEAFKKFRDRLVVMQVSRARIPEFGEDTPCRVRVRFSGRVQKVGFRLEVSELAKRLGLTGYCENLPGGDVLAELQGKRTQIDFLISFMESLKRIKITNKIMEELPCCPEETGFARR